MATKKRRTNRRGLGADSATHHRLLSERLTSATRFYADATKHAKSGNCSGAITSLMLGASYEGEGQAHAETGGDYERRMGRVRTVMGKRDKAQSAVIKACSR